MSKIWLESWLLYLSCSIACLEYTWRTTELLYEKTWSSTKPEVHNISLSRQRTTEPRTQLATCTINNSWNSVVWLLTYASGQTDRQTKRTKTRHNAVPPPSRGWSNLNKQEENVEYLPTVSDRVAQHVTYMLTSSTDLRSTLDWCRRYCSYYCCCCCCCGCPWQRIQLMQAAAAAWDATYLGSSVTATPLYSITSYM